ncbi:hypothetical protein [Bowmanella dokdonensis]|uniref:Uncharacterized protein n=1 Tax=Bowmanella dokdonensis TaxID=751969 RepID=A0A939DPZ4_9ALTE|nr:hypothetical protein [Bowmanella dokdonensis]MBN7825816.1 hypothetical protein [Bowmanella dokdonensis]
MSEQDPLKARWQSLDLELPDTRELEKRWRRTRWRQWSFLLLDLGALVVLAVLYAQLRHELHWFERFWIIAMLGVALLATGYALWLRRMILRASRGDIRHYLLCLLQQGRNNLQLVRLTRACLLAMPLAFVLLMAGGWYFGAISSEALKVRGSLTLLALLVIIPPWWWLTARQREKRQQELESLEQLHQSLHGQI